MRNKAGFTLIELVMVILLTGILAVFAAPKAALFNSMDSAGASDEILSVVSGAQKLAIASRQPIWVVSSSASVRACYDAACARPATRFSGEPLSVSAPNASYPIAASVAAFSFDAQGRPSVSAQATIDCYGKRVRIEPETGLVWS